MTDDADQPQTPEEKRTALERGAALIRAFVRTLPDSPGVYRMLDEKGDALYVGKAKYLKRRVANYANTHQLPLRLQRMVALTVDMNFVTTHTEVEALLLESNLIKKLKPRYNVLLRDDKSFPYILITGDHEFPLLTKHRGARTRPGEYFGPFAAAGAVNDVLIALQKAFMLRNCSDNIFAARTRPCLQYHIKRCTAPCVGMVSADDYARQVAQATGFLGGKSTEIQAELAARMQDASDRQDYEVAAALRDRIRALTAVQARQDINVPGLRDADVIALWPEEGRSCVQVFFFRGGQNFGNRSYFPRHSADDTPAAIIGAFMAQFYENKPVPPDIMVSHEPDDAELLAEALSAPGKAGRKVTISIPQRGDRKRLLDFALDNARQALARESLKLAGEKAMLDAVAALFDLEDAPQRIEIYDNSHVSGTNMVGGMVVAGPEGFRKTAYRKFNIKTAEAADDFGMMREVIARRFGRALKEGKGPGAEDWPDLVLIDGGAGQLSAVMEALAELGVAEQLNVVAISKGPDRNAGREKFHRPGRDMFQLPVDEPVLHYLQRLRDEAHRFAIGAHRARRTAEITASPLDEIAGIGARRKKALLHYFGSAQEVARAGIDDLQKVEGISRAIAEQIYRHFHE
jgi:excinuclease ABC subunit C